MGWALRSRVSPWLQEDICLDTWVSALLLKAEVYSPVSPFVSEGRAAQSHVSRTGRGWHRVESAL